MQVFAVFGVENNYRVQNGLREHYRDQHYNVGKGVYLLATKDETTREVATKIGLGDEQEGRELSAGIVVPVTSFWGRGKSEMWEWIVVKKRADG